MAIQVTARTIDVKFEVRWNGIAWTDESTRLVDASGGLEYVGPAQSLNGTKAIIQQCKVNLANHDYRYSPYNAAGPLYAHIGSGAAYHRKARLSVNIDGAGYEYIFTGYIRIPSENYMKGTVTFTLWDSGEILRMREFSTTILQDYREDVLIAHYLGGAVANLTDGVDFVSQAYHTANPGTPATLDASTMDIPDSWLDDESIWDEINDVALASGGRVYVDRKGVMHFEKGWHWAVNNLATSETLTVHDWTELSPVYEDRDLFDAIKVDYTARILGIVGAALWEQSDALAIYPGESEEIEARYRWPAVSVTTPVVDTHYTVVYPGGADAKADHTLGFTAYGSKAELIISNVGTQLILIRDFKIYGDPIWGQPTDQVKRVADPRTYFRTRQMRGNPYVQSRVQAESVADFFQWWDADPKLYFAVSRLPGVPTRELGQRFTVQDAGSVFNRVGILVKLKWSISVQPDMAISYTQDLELVDDVFSTNSYIIVGETDISALAGEVLWF